MPTILTRYLYDKEQAEFSLLVAMLTCDVDQAKFWAYEVYYSGFKYETVTYLLKLFYQLYYKQYPKLENFFDIHFQNWSASDQTYDEFVGMLIENMAIRSPDTSKRNSKFYIKLSAANVARYKTKPVLELQGWRIPRRECRYRLIVKPESQLLTFATYENWLYYASFSPIWRNRIERYGGTVIEKDKKVVFESEESEEQFHCWHNFEPDEQPSWVQSNWIGEQYVYPPMPPSMTNTA